MITLHSVFAMFRNLARAAALSTLMLPIATSAQDDMGLPSVSLRVFGTIGVAGASSQEADFTGTRFQREGIGYSRRWGWGVDSKVGVQAKADLLDCIDGVVQFVSQQRINGSYAPRLEWANIQYQFSPALSVRMGRIVLPAFMASESRLVGYTTTWIRPPVESYGLLPFTNSDGLDATINANFGQSTHAVHVVYGRIQNNAIFGTRSSNLQLPSNFHGIVGIADDLAFGDLTVHAAAITSRVDATSVPGRVKLSFMNVGLAYDPGSWFVQTELSRLLLPVFTGNSKSAYLMGGMRYGAWTPYLIFSILKPDDRTNFPAALDQRAVSGGLRWDFAQQAALKIQLDDIRVKPSLQGVGTFVNVQPGFLRDSSSRVLSIALDFAF